MKKIIKTIVKEITHYRRKWGYLFIMPGIIYYIVVMAYPIGTDFFLSFHRWPGFSGIPRFVGLNNFMEVFQNNIFLLSLRNTAYYSLLGVPLSIIIPLFLAVLVFEKLPFKNLFQLIYFLPVVVSIVAIGTVWGWLYQPTFGLFNNILRHFNLPQQDWIKGRGSVIPCLAVVFIWFRTGFNLVIYLAGLSGIPNSLYESARVDGASRLQEVVYITFPLLIPTTVFLLITTTLYSFQVFDLIYVMTQGGPGNASRTIGFEIYEKVFLFFDTGPAMAETIILAAILLAFTAIQLKIGRALKAQF